jgi:hypothetical protein
MISNILAGNRRATQRDATAKQKAIAASAQAAAGGDAASTSPSGCPIGWAAPVGSAPQVWDEQQQRAGLAFSLPAEPSPLVELWDETQYNMQAALQLALELQSASVVAMLLSNGADVGCVLLSRLYLAPEKNRFRLFSNMQVSALRELRETRESATRTAQHLSARAAQQSDGLRPGSAVGWGRRNSNAGLEPRGGEGGELGGMRTSVGARVRPTATSAVHIARNISAQAQGLFPASWVHGGGFEPPSQSTDEKTLLTDPGILSKAQLAAAQQPNDWFIRSERVFQPFIELWLDEEHHGLNFGGSKPWRNVSTPRRVSTDSPHTPPRLGGNRGSSASQIVGGGGGDDASTPAAAPDDPTKVPTTGCRIEDIFFWAVLMGDTELADVLWRFSRTHLRLALLAAEIYTKMMTSSEQGRKHIDEIEPMRRHWELVATDLIENVKPAAKDPRTTFQVAQAVVTWELSLPKRAGERGENVLDLATRLQAKEFIAHRFCQLIMTRNWSGHIRDNPRVPLRLEDDTAPNWKVIWKALLPWKVAEDVLDGVFKLQWIAKVVPNASDAVVPAALVKMASRSDTRAVDRQESRTVAEAVSRTTFYWWQVYSIPVVKFWTRTIVTHGGIALIQSTIVLGTSITAQHGLSARPGPVQGSLELVFLLLVLGIAADWVETRPARQAWARSGLRPAWAYVDSLSLYWQVIVVTLRVIYLLGGTIGSRSFGYGRQDVFTGWIFPISLAFSSLGCFLRFLIETLLVFPRLGVLAICTREMLANNLLQWGVMMVRAAPLQPWAARAEAERPRRAIFPSVRRIPRTSSYPSSIAINHCALTISASIAHRPLRLVRSPVNRALRFRPRVCSTHARLPIRPGDARLLPHRLRRPVAPPSARHQQRQRPARLPAAVRDGAVVHLRVGALWRLPNRHARGRALALAVALPDRTAHHCAGVAPQFVDCHDD